MPVSRCEQFIGGRESEALLISCMLGEMNGIPKPGGNPRVTNRIRLLDADPLAGSWHDGTDIQLFPHACGEDAG